MVSIAYNIYVPKRHKVVTKISDRDIIYEIMKNNNGLLYASQAKEAGINNKILQRLTESGKIERIERGVYIDSEMIGDEYLLAQYRCKKGIYSHETALFFHDLSDRTPFQLTMTIPSGYTTRLLKEKEKFRFFYITKEIYEIGKITIKSPHGNDISVYDRERTICDSINKREILDKDLVLSALKMYFKSKKTDYSKLLYYAELLKIKEVVQRYMEVLT